MSGPHDRRVVQCNVTMGQRTAAQGARAYLVRTNPGSGNDRIVVLLRSRSGRMIQTWQDIRRVANFRVKTLPPDHPLHGDERLWEYEPDATAAQLNRDRSDIVLDRIDRALAETSSSET